MRRVSFPLGFVIVLTFVVKAQAATIFIANGAVNTVDANNSFPSDRLIIGEFASGGTSTQPTTLEILNGGIVDQFTVTYSSIVNVRGGIVQQQVGAVRNGTINVFGGQIGQGANIGSSGRMNVFGGTIGRELHVTDNGFASIFGGSISARLIASVFGTIEIHASQANFGFGAISAAAGTINGTLCDGSSFDTTFERLLLGGSRGSIVLVDSCGVNQVPLPAAFPLFIVGLAGLGFMKRTRSKSRAEIANDNGAGVRVK